MSNQIETKAEILDEQDSIETNLSSARAILDCVRVLTALERTQRSDDSAITGGGYAAGYIARDTSVPLALTHAMALIDQAHKTANQICRTALGSQDL